MQSLGYVTLQSTRRPRAAKPTISGVFDAAGESFRHLLGEAHLSSYLDQIRLYIEVGAVRTAAHNATNLHLTAIHAALEQCSGSINDDSAFAKADAAFHRSIVAVTANPILLELHDRFVYELVASREANVHPIPSNEKSYDEHCQIYEAIVEGDTELAMSIMDQHLSRSFRSRLPRAENRINTPGDQSDNESA